MRGLRRLLILIVALVAGAVLARRRIFAWGLRLRRPTNAYKRETGIAIPAPDGITLATDHYIPDIPAPAPTILIRSPYGRNETCSTYGRLLAFFAGRFAERGYHVVVQDTRGRFDSGGKFRPYVDERRDGLATLDWLRAQDWFNGEVGLWGVSYLGLVQWVIADQPEVKAMLPIFTASRLYPILYPDGAFSLGLIGRWLAIFAALDAYRGKSPIAMLGIMPYAERLARKEFDRLPLHPDNIDLLQGDRDGYIGWLENTLPDDQLWQDIDALVDWDAIDVPAHLIVGWHDFFQRVQLDDYARLKAKGLNPLLTIGPWSHFSDVNGLVTGIREGMTLFDRHLQERDVAKRPHPVRLYVMDGGMSKGEWRDYDDYPILATPAEFYLSPGGLSSEPSPEAATTQYTYDPANPTPSTGGAQFIYDVRTMVDNRDFAARSDVVTFTGEPLHEMAEVIGNVRLVLYVESSCETTDFYGKLCDVTPDGRMMNVCDGLVRVVPGMGERQPDGSRCIEIDLWHTAYRFHAGHRIAVMVTSGAHPRWNRNYGTGESLLTATQMQPAEQTIHHDAAHPSRLVLPVTTTGKQQSSHVTERKQAMSHMNGSGA